MAREKKWVDCPICGAKGTMRQKKKTKETFKNPQYDPITVKNLDGQFCQKCGDGFYSIASKRRLQSELADAMAKQDSHRVVAAALVDTAYIARRLAVSGKRVRQMMEEGKLKYVYVAGTKYPLKPSDKELAEKKNKLRGRKN